MAVSARRRHLWGPEVEAVPESLSRALIAVLVSKSPRTVRGLAAVADLPPITLYDQLRKLRDRGLVDWSPGRRSTLHLTCTIHEPGRPDAT